MAVFSKLLTAVHQQDFSHLLTLVQEKVKLGHDLVKAHPWSSAGLGLLGVIVWKYVITAPRNLPPGPHGYPLVGATETFDSWSLPQTMMEWRKKYGEIISFYRFGTLNIVLNSDRTIREGFLQKGDELAHRDMSMFDFGTVSEFHDEIFGGEFNDQWKKNKKFARSSLKNYGFGTARSEAKIHEHMTALEESVEKSKGNPMNIYPELQLLSSAIVCSMILGLDATRDDPFADRLVKLMDGWIATMSAIFTKRGNIGGMIPKLGDLWSGKELREYQKTHNEGIEVIRDRILATVTEMEQDPEPQSVIASYIKERGSGRKEVGIMAATVMTFLGDAITNSSLAQFACLQYICHKPEVQKAAQKEIARVVGSSRLPSFNDRAQMPFVQGCIHETLRINAPMQMSSARVLRTTEQIDGYTLPRGAKVMANFFSVNFDPEIFPDPYTFNPWRFVDEKGEFRNDLAAKLMTFSQGPRRCLGEPFFKVNTFLIVSRILQRYNLKFDPKVNKTDLDEQVAMMYKMLMASTDMCFEPRE